MRSRCAWISNNYSRPFTLCNVWAYSFTKMNSFGLCSGFFSSFSLSGFYDTIDIKAIKFVRWDKYCEAFGRIACYIAIIMCAYGNIANTKRTESMDFLFLFLATVRPLRWVQSSQHDVAWIRMMAPTCRQPGMKSRMRHWNGGKTNYAPSTRVDWIAFEWI